MRDVLILRPEPGASRTGERALRMGLHAIIAPLFTAAPMAWNLPPGPWDALVMTSAQAAHLGGETLRGLAAVPLWAVGGGTAEAAMRAGFADVRTAGPDVAGLFAALRGSGARRVLRLAGREHMPTPPFPGEVTTVAVYAADAAERLPETARRALEDGAVVLLHSPRAARVLFALAGSAGASLARSIAAALSPAVASAAGGGWAAVHATPEPTDAALLALAARLCDTGGR